MNHFVAATPLVFRKMMQKKCTQFFQNRRPTPLSKEDVPRHLLLPTPSPCKDDPPLYMAQLYLLSTYCGRTEKCFSSTLTSKKEKDKKSITKGQDVTLEKSIWDSGKRKVFPLGCLTPAIQGRSSVDCSSVHGFAFDSPLSPLRLRVEQRTNNPDSIPSKAKRTFKKSFGSLSKRRVPGSARRTNTWEDLGEVPTKVSLI